MNEREKHVAKLQEAREQLKTATGYRKRDIHRYVCRLEKELLIYDKYHRG
jgi:hypothetical protein